MDYLVTLVTIGGVYVLVLAAICDEDEIVYSFRLTGCLMAAFFLTTITIGMLDAVVRAVYARL